MLATAGTSDESCYSFLFKNNQKQPMLLTRTARLLGCNPHQHFKKLVNGESVELENGDIVTPEMVMGEPDKAKNLMSVFLPGPEYIDSFLE